MLLESPKSLCVSFFFFLPQTKKLLVGKRKLLRVCVKCFLYEGCWNPNAKKHFYPKEKFYIEFSVKSYFVFFFFCEVTLSFFCLGIVETRKIKEQKNVRIYRFVLSPELLKNVSILCLEMKGEIISFKILKKG